MTVIRIGRQIREAISSVVRRVIESLLRARPVDQLQDIPRGPVLGAVGYAELFPPEPIPTPRQGGTWLCWPSADAAIHGWGDPYEDPPGVPVNPPLGTVQTSYSDTARIARQLDVDDNVTHGVNKIAAIRDWRSPNTSLVLSWDDGDIYSGGDSVISGAGILAACVRYEANVPYLLWVEDDSNPPRIWRQECVIVSNVVTGVVGDTSFCTISNSTGYFLANPTWLEFSQDGNSLVMNQGFSMTSFIIDELAVPAVFQGQEVDKVRLKSPGAQEITWNAGNDYIGTREFPAKAQYINNVLNFVTVKLTIERTISSDVQILQTWPEGNPPDQSTFFFCGGDYTIAEAFYGTPGDGGIKLVTADIEDNFVVKTEILLNDNTVPEFTAISNTYKFTRTQEFLDDVSYTDEIANELMMPWVPPSGWGCAPSVNSDLLVPEPPPDIVTAAEDTTYFVFPTQCFDIRFSRLFNIELGTVDWQAGPDYNYYLKPLVIRNGMIVDSVQTEGAFSRNYVPRRQDIQFEADLRNELDDYDDYVCQAERFGIDLIGFGDIRVVASLDLNESRSVHCVCALNGNPSEDRYASLIENGDILQILSIDSEPGARIIQRNNVRFLGLLSQD